MDKDKKNDDKDEIKIIDIDSEASDKNENRDKDTGTEAYNRSDEKDADEEIMDPEKLDDDIDSDDDIDFGAYYNDEPEKNDEDKKKHQHKHKGRTAGLVIAALAVFMAAAAFLLYKYVPGKERADYSQYFGVSGDEAKVIYNFELTDYSAFVRDGKYYIENQFYIDNITDKFFYDAGNNGVIYTTSEQIYTIPVGSKEYDVDGEKKTSDYVISLYEDDTLYVAVDFARDKGDFTYETYDEPDRIAIVSGGTNENTVELLEKGTVRQDADIKSPIWEKYGDAFMSEWMTTGEEKEGWIGVKTSDGRYGYIKKRQCRTDDSMIRKFESGYTAPVYPSQVRDYDILLVWHAVYDQNDNNKIPALLEPTKGVNVVSPTWYKASDSEGTIESLADKEYVDYVHKQGMEIWPLISDFTSVDSENGWDEKKLLGTTSSRRTLIDNLMKEAETYGYDGINIDFEKVPKEAGAEFTQFVRELSIKCRKAGIVLSIDNYVPKPYNMQYNRTAQGECADYVIVMGYDEHYSGCDEAGSVASIGFVTEGMDETLKEVPAEKVINAVPFYTRMFSTTGTEGEKPESKAYSMQGAIDAADELGLEKSWDSAAMQNVAEGWSEGKYYSVWLEDEKSMAVRIRAVRDRHLAGVAAWSLGMELDSIWDVINNS